MVAGGWSVEGELIARPVTSGLVAFEEPFEAPEQVSQVDDVLVGGGKCPSEV